jgi:Xaa-Pro aminopeptidase
MAILQTCEMNYKGINRRAFIGSASVLAAASSTSVSAKVLSQTHPKRTSAVAEISPRPIPLNRERATKVMAEHGLDGLIASNERNVFYATNLWPLFTIMRRPHPTLAVIPADPDRPVIAVAPATEIWTTAQQNHIWPEMIVYTAPVDPDEYREYLKRLEGGAASGIGLQPKAHQLGYWKKDHPEAKHSAYEQRLEDGVARYGTAAAPTWQAGLARALAECGVQRGTLGIDDRGIDAELAEFLDSSSNLVPAENIFRKIRIVKSRFEVEQMRRAAQTNADAAFAAAEQIERGMTDYDIRTLFNIEAAKRGANPQFVVVDTVGGLSRGEVTEGQPIMIDAVSDLEHYHGDFGRTVVLGEPTKELQRRVATISASWEAVMELLRPGVRYSDIRETAKKAANRINLGDFDFRVTPHSVGLQHTDEPYRFGMPYPVKDDLVLEDGMTITVDFPMVSPGWGSCHLEDLVLITADGAEPLNRQGRNVITI